MNYNKLIQNKNILISGGAGFVGSHLAIRLLNNGNRVFVIDNYFTGKKSNHHKGIIYIKSETKNVYKIYKNISLDYIYHLGEYSRVEQSYEDVELVIKYNSQPFFELLKLAKHHNAKLIYSGSSTKFAKNLDKIESPYSFTKRINTEFLRLYARWFKLKYAIAYFYNVYGEKEISEGKYATVIAKFLYLKKNGYTFLPITSPGTQKRRFTHIEDIVNGLIIVGKKGNGDGYGIGSEKSYSIIDLAKILKMNYKLTPSKKGNRMNALLKIKKTKLLGWKAKHSLVEYLKNLNE